VINIRFNWYYPARFISGGIFSHTTGTTAWKVTRGTAFCNYLRTLFIWMFGTVVFLPYLHCCLLHLTLLPAPSALQPVPLGTASCLTWHCYLSHLAWISVPSSLLPVPPGPATCPTRPCYLSYPTPAPVPPDTAACHTWHCCLASCQLPVSSVFIKQVLSLTTETINE
jgi:hypothetical protein